ncbi:MAG: T9SS C-terminal target domain-containing protein [Bacteroidetes bacterium]|nr:MAG: T9SS C-terminal target domain-containing protein [Bacteroidota bacterium]
MKYFCINLYQQTLNKKLLLTIIFSIITFFTLFSAPSVTITAPNLGTKFKGGQEITFTGFATHTLLGTLKKENFRWRVDYRHDDHWHDNFAFASGDSNFIFGISDFGGDPSPTIYFSVKLFVSTTAAGAGLEETLVEYILEPKISNVTITSNPIGVQFKLGIGSVFTTPTIISATQLYKFSLSSNADLQTINGIAYKFKNWSSCTTNTGILLTMLETNQVISLNFEPESSFKPGLEPNCITTIDDKFNNSQFDIFPNPTDGFLHISNQYTELELFDVFGRKREFNIENNPQYNKINIIKLPPSTYILKFNYNNYTHFKQIIKQ